MKSVNAVVLCPMRPGMNPRLVEKQKELLLRATGEWYNESIPITIKPLIIDWEPQWKTPITCHADRATHIAAVRNHAIAFLMTNQKYYGKITHVIWMDADIVDYDRQLFFDLVRTSAAKNAVTAPLVFLEEAGGKVRPGRWYDTAGFIHQGERAALDYPWFTGAPLAMPPLFEMDGSVGCVYCVPWEVYLQGGTHHFCGEKFTEHYPVCQHARRMGMKLLVMTDKKVEHAYLPDYGEEFH